MRCDDTTARVARWCRALCLALAAALAACGGPQPPAPAPAPARAATPGPGQFTNPVIARDFADPDVLQVGDRYYAYATNASGANVQTATSSDLVRWERGRDALPVLPRWSRPGFTWAPEVAAAEGGGYVLYFTARHVASGRQCIGAATSPAPEGPFRSEAAEPLICQLDQGGSIDASSFADEGGARYLLWKNDGNCCGYDTWIFIQRVSADGLALLGEPTRLIRPDQAWEGRLVEAPTLWERAGKYYLFYSANSYAGLDYAVGYAVADSPTGPFRKPGRAPLLATDRQTGAAFGPGGQDVVLDKDGEPWMLYHAWDATISYRHLLLDELVWEGDAPVVRGPDKGPQPVP